MFNLSGRFASLPTPYTDDGSTVSEVRLARVIRRLVEQDVDGFLVGGEVGEFWVCSMSERKQCLEIAQREGHGRPVIVNVTALSTAGSLDLAQHAARHGARACVIAPPSYVPFTEAEVAQHFQNVAAHCDLPLIVVGAEASIAGRVYFGEPLPNGWFDHATTDEFAVESLKVSPNFLFFRVMEPSEEMRALASEAGSARLAKAGLEHQDLDCGPLRGPYRWPTSAQVSRLKELL